MASAHIVFLSVLVIHFLNMRKVLESDEQIPDKPFGSDCEVTHIEAGEGGVRGE